jgi:uncharacterized repeat protein (TIGR01451 family)
MKKITALLWPIMMLALLFVTLHLVVQSSGAATDVSIVGDIEAGINQVGSPWYNPLWHYRRPVIISNSSGQSLDDYQVLIKLDNSNFDFNKAVDQGWDVRITTNDGSTEINYWIESWSRASHTAYIWVKIPHLEIGNTTIYLYYNNPGVSTTSDGSATFDLFDDDWSQFTGAGCVAPECKWYIRNGDPKVYSGKLELTYGTGISTINLYQYKAVGYKANFFKDTLGIHGYEWGGFINGVDGPRTMIRDLYSPFDVNGLFLQNRVDNDNNNPLNGNNWHNDYHIYEVRWRQGESIGDIDHGTSYIASSDSSEVPSDQLPVTFYSLLNSNDALWVDWVYVREYHDPEPTVTIGIEQGSVDLRVIQVDSPDPLYAGEELTYALTISNLSSIDAPGVILTDTLPGEVNFTSAVPSQGSCISEVVCSLGTIPANSAATITVKVTTTIDGVVTNTGVVISSGYDLNIGNNTSQEMTTVLPSADLAIIINGYPEVVKPGDLLTYALTINNQGPSDAEMVEVVNNLPTEVDYQDSYPQICTESEHIVTCIVVDPLASNAATQILIIAKVISSTTVNIYSTATVSSSTYDPNPTNNTSQEETLVDAEKPIVNWKSPVSNEQTYFTAKNTITLIASATDNNQVDRVNFQLWDHLWNNGHGHYVDIGTATAEPYQVEFDTNMLEPGTIYQMYVTAFDRADNASIRQRIFIERLFPIFLPIIEKK